MKEIFGKAYNYAEEGNVQVSTHFKLTEFKCRDKEDFGIVFIHENLVTLLEDIREHFGKPVHINSAYRTPQYNKKVGGAKDSKHMYGMAADIWISGVGTKEVAQYASKKLGTRGGVIRYTNFVHVDVRDDERYRKGVE